MNINETIQFNIYSLLSSTSSSLLWEQPHSCAPPASWLPARGKQKLVGIFISAANVIVKLWGWSSGYKIGSL